jgi:hypothetical protein
MARYGVLDLFVVCEHTCSSQANALHIVKWETDKRRMLTRKRKRLETSQSRRSLWIVIR